MYSTLITFHAAVLRCFWGSCQNRPLRLLPSPAADQTIPSCTHPLHLNSEVESPGDRETAATLCLSRLINMTNVFA